MSDAGGAWTLRRFHLLYVHLAVVTPFGPGKYSSGKGRVRINRPLIIWGGCVVHFFKHHPMVAGEVLVVQVFLGIPLNIFFREKGLKDFFFPVFLPPPGWVRGDPVYHTLYNKNSITSISFPATFGWNLKIRSQVNVLLMVGCSHLDYTYELSPTYCKISVRSPPVWTAEASDYRLRSRGDNTFDSISHLSHAWNI